MPFKATRRHQCWTVGVCYLDMHRLGRRLTSSVHPQTDTHAHIGQIRVLIWKELSQKLTRRSNRIDR